MVQRWTTAAVAVVCVVGLAIPASASATRTAAPKASAAVSSGFVGMNIDGPLFPTTAPGVNIGAQMQKMVAAGVGTVRVVFDWSYAQPYGRWSEVPADIKSEFVNDNGIPTRYGDLDQLVTLAAQYGLQLMPIVLYTPGWDAAPHPSDSFASPQKDGPYANFLSDLVDRYGLHGTLWQTTSPVLPVRMWQIWNEPNIHVFWSKQPFQASYIALLKAAHRAIKAIDPGAKVVLAGLPNYSWRQLATIYKVRGAKGQFDVVAVHPYTADPNGVITILGYVRNVMNAAGDERKPIIADEISWPSSLGKTGHNNGLDIATTEAGQARKIAELLPLLGADRERLNLLGFYYYTWAGRDDSDGGAFDFSGLFHYGHDAFTAKPAFDAFQKAALALEHCRRKGIVPTVCASPS
jgi:hypothetical protein